MSTKIAEQNKQLISQFESELKQEGLAKSTIKNHVYNIDFFAEYLGYYDDPIPLLETDSSDIDSFLGDWFVRKAGWASPSSIKSNISSFKKFYKWVKIQHSFPKEEYELILDTIKLNKNEWIESAEIDDDYF